MIDIFKRYFVANEAKVISFGIRPQSPEWLCKKVGWRGWFSVWRFSNARVLNFGRLQVSFRWPYFKAFKLINGRWQVPHDL